jgi:hypothetical protein
MGEKREKPEIEWWKWRYLIMGMGVSELLELLQCRFLPQNGGGGGEE